MAVEITNYVKQAREQALLGLYDEAEIFYGGAIQDVQKMMKQDPEKQLKWKEVTAWRTSFDWFVTFSIHLGLGDVEKRTRAGEISEQNSRQF